MGWIIEIVDGKKSLKNSHIQKEKKVVVQINPPTKEMNLILDS